MRDSAGQPFFFEGFCVPCAELKSWNLGGVKVFVSVCCNGEFEDGFLCVYIGVAVMFSVSRFER